ncbi:hypothetical protein ACQP1O_18750 [Nocardia sp. CA-151230]|uniref:hypothetical protein n=1 Tax=Nocardia sp. CA-151230 TaxID=3239982 RepID=UPI003D90A051
MSSTSSTSGIETRERSFHLPDHPGVRVLLCTMQADSPRMSNVGAALANSNCAGYSKLRDFFDPLSMT